MSSFEDQSENIESSPDNNELSEDENLEEDSDNELSQEELENLEKRTKILADEGNQAFNRFLSNLDAITKKIISLFQIFLVLISIEVGIITFHLQNGFEFSSVSQFLVYWVICWGFYSFVILIYLLYPKKFNDISIFEEKRFIELCNTDSLDLLSDFLYQMKSSYQSAVPIYNRITGWFFIGYTSVIVMTISYIVLIISLRLT